MVKTGLGASVAALTFSLVVAGVLHFALSQYRTGALPAVSGEITSSIPR
ncbi:hypothetical protein QN219_06500 [Sinorhizobium sp. 7-81]|nr:hypothetical protein [Sinorhizobium sp. 8-89]MDK1489708.1 hypothetical protein [Sinorhizobium sp. 8-89]